MRELPIALGLVWLLIVFVAGCGGDEDEPALELSAEAEAGREIVETRGCAACHGADGRGVVGPSWDGLPGGEVELEDGTMVLADEAYLLRAILAPDAEIRAGFQLEMPENDLTPAEAESVIAYMKALP